MMSDTWIGASTTFWEPNSTGQQTEADAYVTSGNTYETEPAKITTDAVLKVIYLVIGGAGLTGNLLVVVVLLNKSSMLKSFTNMYILSQSVIDGTVSVILLITTLLEDSGRHLTGTADDVLCRMWLTNLPLWGLLVSSSYNIVVMTIERYLAVVHPIWHKVKMTRGKVVVSLVAAWIVGPLYQGAFKIPTTRIVSGRCYLFQHWPSQFTRQAVGVVTVTVQYVIPLILLTALYTKMALVLHRRVMPLEDATNPTGSATITTKAPKSMERARGNVIKTLAMVSACYLLCWTCNQMYFLAFNLGRPLGFSTPFYHFTVIAVYVNSSINPVIYAAKYEQYQRALWRLVRRVTCGRLNRKVAPESSGKTSGNVTATHLK